MRILRAVVPLLACFATLGVRALPAADGEALLGQARESLTGAHKDTEQARKALLEIARDPSSLSPSMLPYAYVYLGYIEDHAGNRPAAIDWYRKALAVEGGDPGIEAVAKRGLERAITWIRHLDAPETQPAPRNAEAPSVEASRPSKAYLIEQPPAGVTLARHLSAQERRANFEELWKTIDISYADFKLKSIDWPEVGRRYRARLDRVTNDDDFYLLMFQLVNELKDTHSWIENYKPPAGSATAVSIDLFEGKPYVVAVRSGSDAAEAGVKPGWEVLSVDGMTIADKTEALRPFLHACPTESAYRREAARALLTGAGGTAVKVDFRSPDGAAATVALRRAPGAAPRPPARAFAFPLTRQKLVHFGLLPSGLGYIWIESFNGRQDIVDEFYRALDKVGSAPGLILDIRDNPGGFGQPLIVQSLLKKRALTSISYMKQGTGHGALDRHEQYLDPIPGTSYKGPIALLVNEGTGSASDLFACELRGAGRVLTVGTATHGNLSGVAIYAVLPCGMVVRISNGYISDAKDRPIEGRGNTPDAVVAPTVADFLAGRDPVLDKAAELLLRQAPKK